MGSLEKSSDGTKTQDVSQGRTPQFDESAHLRDGWLSSVRGENAEFTPDFKEWFGNSVVVTESRTGRQPAVLYHLWRTRFPSRKQEPSFDIERTQWGMHFGTAQAARARYEDLDTFPEFIEGAAAKTIPVVIRMEHPLYMKDVGTFEIKNKEAVTELIDAISRDTQDKDVSFSAETLTGLKSVRQLHEILRSLGYDGIIYRNNVEERDDSNSTNKVSSDSVIVFDPASQVRSAITGAPIMKGNVLGGF